MSANWPESEVALKGGRQTHPQLPSEAPRGPRLKVPQWTDGIWIEPLAVLMLGTYPSCSYLEALRSALNSKRTSRRPEAWVGTHEPSPSSQNKPTVQLKEIKTAVAPVVCTDSQWGGMEEGVILAVRFFLGASACLNRRVITQTPDAYAWGHRTVSVMALSYEHAWHGGCSNCNTLLLAAFNSHQISSACNACDCQIRPSVNTKTCKLSPNSWQSCSGRPPPVSPAVMSVGKLKYPVANITVYESVCHCLSTQ
nr:PREDICTED: uncharacterized protein LOC104151280 [Struthio camelus australis]